MGKKILVCGHRSFAAQGLTQELQESGHDVVRFSRGRIECSSDVVTGPVHQVHENPHLDDSFDTVINYILLSEGSKQENEAYLDSLVRFCEHKGVKHLIHISSISVYKAEEPLITETAEMESDPSRKGGYGSVKVIQDLFLESRVPSSIKLSLVRPGFILGTGLPNPIAGTGFRTPWNRLLLIGNNRSHLPLIGRHQVNRSLRKLVDRPPQESQEVLVITDSDSPTKQEYLDACCELLGCGTNTISLPKAFWIPAAAGASTLLNLAGKKEIKLFQKIQAVCRDKDFDTQKSEQRLGESFRLDWRQALLDAIEGQNKNFDLPSPPAKKLGTIAAKTITYLGFGRVVQSKHLPALRKLGFSGSVAAYDVGPIQPPKDMPFAAISEDGVESSDLFVVATPGPVHHNLAEQLGKVDGDILVEKPLCYSREQFETIRSLQTSGRKIYVCHNYRLKQNVLAMQEHLRAYNPGRLISVSVDLQTPPVSQDGAAWMRKERLARTLLMDYAIHYIDIACMFGQGAWNVDSLRFDVNKSGETANIHANVSADNYGVSLNLRQGFIPRKHQIVFNFQNYTINLRFFPDVVVAHMANDYDWVHRMEARKLAQGIRGKVMDKVLSRDSDLSHARVYESVIEKRHAEPLSLDRLESFYGLIFDLGDAIYGDDQRQPA